MRRVCRLFVTAQCGMTQSGVPWRRWSAAYGKGNAVAARPAGAIKASGRAGWPTGRSIRIGRSAARRVRPQRKRRIPRGRSRGGFRIQIPSLTDRQGRSLPLRGPSAPRHGRTQARVETGTGARTPCLTPRNGTRRATPWHAALAGSRGDGAWPPAAINTHIAAWGFGTWRGLGSG